MEDKYSYIEQGKKKLIYNKKIYQNKINRQKNLV